jgi:hypothetical protein
MDNSDQAAFKHFPLARSLKVLEFKLNELRQMLYFVYVP